MAAINRVLRGQFSISREKRVEIDPMGVVSGSGFA
jgi:hypothetical protein